MAGRMFSISALPSSSSRPSGPLRTGADGSGVIFGTPAYLSPEQARGAEVDHRSDVFSFGTLLYEMATGRGSVQRGLCRGYDRCHPEGATAPASEINPQLPPSLSKVIDRALAKDPADRYQSVDELKGDLQRVLPAACGDGEGRAAAVARSVREHLRPRRLRPARTLCVVDPAERRRPRDCARPGDGCLQSPACTAWSEVVWQIDGIAVLPFGHQKDAGDLDI